MLKKIFIGCGVLIVAAIALMMVALIYIGAVSPSTRVRAGDQVRTKFVDELRELGMLEPGEELRYFYSDGLLSIREGSYVLTDRALVVFIEEEIDPPLRLHFDEIVAIECDFSDEFLLDSDAFVHYLIEDESGGETEDWVFIVLSNEDGGDRLFLEALSESTGVPLQDQEWPEDE